MSRKDNTFLMSLMIDIHMLKSFCHNPATNHSNQIAAKDNQMFIVAKDPHKGTLSKPYGMKFLFKWLDIMIPNCKQCNLPQLLS